jgi:hypothetical protein
MKDLNNLGFKLKFSEPHVHRRVIKSQQFYYSGLSLV